MDLKHPIEMLRDLGWTYAEIGARLGIPARRASAISRRMTKNESWHEARAALAESVTTPEEFWRVEGHDDIPDEDELIFEALLVVDSGPPPHFTVRTTERRRRGVPVQSV